MARQIYTKNPDEEVAAKMFRIATVLGAQVQGEEGERYDADGQPIPDAESHPSAPSAPAKSKPWWRFW